MTTTTTQSVPITKHQADLLLWCYEQMAIDISDNEEHELAPLIVKLDEIANS